jgi:hypothetical protein
MNKYYLPARDTQLLVGECNSSCQSLNFRPENRDLSNRSSELTSQTTEFNAGSRNYHPVTGRFNTIYMGDIVNFLVHSRRRVLHGVPSQLTQANLPETNRPFTESVPHPPELTSWFAESM